MLSLEQFNLRGRSDFVGAMAEKPCDLIVIGGGITGAALFRDAVQRGLRVALLEARDFASGTSSRSSKLIHGGLRYLAKLGFKLAWESCRERNTHIRLNKRLVKPIPFLVPLYKGEKPGRSSMRAGMLVYELLGGLRNERFHRFLSREDTLLAAPGIPVSGLTGSVLYYDAVVSDSRWTIEMIKDAVRAGGLALNHSPVVGFEERNGQVVGVAARDQVAQREFHVSAKVIVNATGVACDRIRRLDEADATPLVRGSRGTHLVFRDVDLPLNMTTVFTSAVDGRSLFLVRRDGSFLFGTTDNWTNDPPDAPTPCAGDVRYLVDSLEAFLPECTPVLDKVRYVYSGFRPLPIAGSQPAASPSDAARDDLIVTSNSGLVTVVGGKLTTARIMARRVLDRMARRFGPGVRLGPCISGRTSIGGDNEQVAEGLAACVRQHPPLSEYFRILFERYGSDAVNICRQAGAIARGDRADPAAEPIRAEVEYVCRHEMVGSVEDLIERRAGFLDWDVANRLARVEHGRRVIAAELELSTEDWERQVGEYRAYLQRFHTLPEL